MVHHANHPLQTASLMLKLTLRLALYINLHSVYSGDFNGVKNDDKMVTKCKNFNGSTFCNVWVTKPHL